VWNEKNTYGFDGVDWGARQGAATITTISRFMKFERRQRGVNALVIPNGIPARLLDGPPPDLVKRFREAIGGDPFLAKVGRFDPDKRWFQAIDATHELRKRGGRPRLVIRGGSEPHGREVVLRAKAAGLSVDEFTGSIGEPDFFSALAETSGDVVVLATPLPPPVLFALYAAADAVLANSGKEPFGLVGLEVMAAGGLPVCGATGEEYAEPFVNAIVCDTGDGISSEFLPFVFDRYSQGNARRNAGLGLGLSIVKYIVDLHGGSVAAASAGEGKGSTFTVRIPADAGAG